MEPFGCVVASGMGFVAACFFSTLPILALFMKKSRDHAKEMLSAPRSRISRATATVLSKSTVVTSNTDGGISTSHYFEIAFIATHTDGSMYRVQSKKMVGPKAFAELSENSQVEVLFPVNEERYFEIITNLTERPSPAVLGILTVFLGISAFVGLGVVAFSVVAGECWLGIPVFLVVVVAMLLFANILFWPWFQKNKTANRSAVVTPVEHPYLVQPIVLQATVVGEV